jgi:hypothetical protein
LLGSVPQHFAVVDEVGHLAAGLSHWETGTFTLYRVNPPLVRLVATLPVLLARPQTDYRHWQDLPGHRPEWSIGQDLSRANRERYCRLVCLARLAGVAWSALGGWLIFCWARQLYGTAAGYLGLVLWCFEPTVLAFAQLDVPDVPATVAGLGATYVFWLYLRRPSWRLAWCAGLLLGVAQLTKFTLLALYGVWPVLWVLQRWRPGWRDQAPRLAVQAGQAVLIGALSLLVLNVGYGFAGTCRPLGEFPFVSRTFAGPPPDGQRHWPVGRSGNRFRQGGLGAVVVPLPADYVRGLDVQRRDFELEMPSYLAGEWRQQGWWYYYLYALAVKVPLGVWGLVLWGLARTVARGAPRAHWADEVALWLPAGVFLGLVSSQTGFNHHMRYVLPLFPFVIVSTSKLAYFLHPWRWPAGLGVAALLLWSAGSSLAVYPHSLSYFNEAAGGPDNGHAHLLDSNLDWGQDLLFLKGWLDRHPEARPLGLACYNLVDPSLVGIEYHLPPVGPPDPLPGDPALLRQFGPQPGYYALDVHFVQGGSFFAPDGQGGLAHVPAQRYAYFRSFRPIAKAGYSIFLYHITPEEADQVRQQMGLPTLRRQPVAHGGLP